MWIKRFLVGREHPWKCLFRHFLRCTFLFEPVECVFTFNNVGPSTMIRLSPFYQQVLDSWFRLRTIARVENEWMVRCDRYHQIALNDLSAHRAYLQLRGFTIHCCVIKFSNYNIDWYSIWKDLDIYFIHKPIWKTNFLLAHGILPTTNRLQRWGISIHQPLWHCEDTETQAH